MRIDNLIFSFNISYRIKIPLEWDVIRMLKVDDEIIFVLNSKMTGMLINRKGKDVALLDELSEHFAPPYRYVRANGWRRGSVNLWKSR